MYYLNFEFFYWWFIILEYVVKYGDLNLLFVYLCEKFLINYFFFLVNEILNIIIDFRFGFGIVMDKVISFFVCRDFK